MLVNSACVSQHTLIILERSPASASSKTMFSCRVGIERNNPLVQ